MPGAVPFRFGQPLAPPPAPANDGDDAYARGFAAGKEALSAHYDAVIAHLDAQLADFEAVIARNCADLGNEAAQLALAIGEQLAGMALTGDPIAAITEALRSALESQPRGTEIRLVVHPDQLEAMRAALEEMQAHDRRRIGVSLSASPDMAPGDATLDWDMGGMQLDAAARRASIARLLEDLSEGRGDGEPAGSPTGPACPSPEPDQP